MPTLTHTPESLLCALGQACCSSTGYPCYTCMLTQACMRLNTRACTHAPTHARIHACARMHVCRAAAALQVRADSLEFSSRTAAQALAKVRPLSRVRARACVRMCEHICVCVRSNKLCKAFCRVHVHT